MLTAVGTGKRMEIVADGECVEASIHLKKLGEYLGAGCLISEEAFSGTENPVNQEMSRFLLWREKNPKDNEEAEAHALRFYQVYADEPFSDREKKEETRGWFERGIQMYERKKWRDARENFAAVLREDIQDQPAGVYFSLCDEYAEEMPYESD